MQPLGKFTDLLLCFAVTPQVVVDDQTIALHVKLPEVLQEHVLGPVLVQWPYLFRGNPVIRINED